MKGVGVVPGLSGHWNGASDRWMVVVRRYFAHRWLAAGGVAQLAVEVGGLVLHDGGWWLSATGVEGMRDGEKVSLCQSALMEHVVSR